ncbi:MAG: bifunctional riboflavin kinase/FAD synthetase [Bacillota bacterium]|nr:bifunctional riboflavin kinase/FAD synthetase [Bacillota bacterium]
MKVFTELKDVRDIESTAIALGNFDGVHKGHQAVIALALKKAGEKGLKSAVFSFLNHPGNTLRGKDSVRNIITWEDKKKIIAGMGVDYLFALPFDDAIRNTAPREFLQEIMIKKLKMKEACCGFNYHFGKGGAGSPGTLRELSWELGFGLEMLDPYLVDGRLVSSTLIRELIRKGAMEDCFRYMGRHYALEGTVMEGNRIGRTLRFPTANAAIEPAMATPAYGVYVTRCTVEGQQWSSITNVGVRPTIGDGVQAMESYLFDFTGELYGKQIRVEFLKKLRDEVKFRSREELAAQIEKDCLTARAYHAKI